MGAAASSPFVATSRFFRKVADDPSAEAVATIDICLACEKDSYAPELKDMSEIKEHFREFMRGVLPTGMYTVFRWSTWDTSNADIVIPTGDLIRARRANVRGWYRMPSRRVFETMHYPFGCISDKSFRKACALLLKLARALAIKLVKRSVYAPHLSATARGVRIQSTAICIVSTKSIALRQGECKWSFGKHRACTRTKQCVRGALRCVPRCKCSRLNVGTMFYNQQAMGQVQANKCAERVIYGKFSADLIAGERRFQCVHT